MSRTLSKLNARLAKVEQKVVDLGIREKLATCNCYRSKELMFVWGSRQFEAVRNVRCPAHAFRCLGQLMLVSVEGDERLGELVQEYERGLAEFLESSPELTDDSDEF